MHYTEKELRLANRFLGTNFYNSIEPDIITIFLLFRISTQHLLGRKNMWKFYYSSLFLWSFFLRLEIGDISHVRSLWLYNNIVWIFTLTEITKHSNLHGVYRHFFPLLSFLLLLLYVPRSWDDNCIKVVCTAAGVNDFVICRIRELIFFFEMRICGIF